MGAPLGRRIYSWEKVENPLDDAALKKKETVAGSKRRKARRESCGMRCLLKHQFWPLLLSPNWTLSSPLRPTGDEEGGKNLFSCRFATTPEICGRMNYHYVIASWMTSPQPSFEWTREKNLSRLLLFFRADYFLFPTVYQTERPPAKATITCIAFAVFPPSRAKIEILEIRFKFWKRRADSAFPPSY